MTRTPSVEQWQVRWDETLSKTIQLHGQSHTPVDNDALRSMINTPLESDLLDGHGFDAWYATLPRPRTAGRVGLGPPVDHGTFASAWERGLRAVIVLPFADDFAEPTVGVGLLMATSTYLHDGKYLAALDDFVPLTP